MDTLLQDLRYALRKLRTAPGFTLAAVACIAVGVGANTAIFSLVNELLLRPVPGLAEPGRLVDVGQSRDGEGSDSLGWMTFADLRTAARTVDLAAWRLTPLALGQGEAPTLVLGAQVSHDYFEVLGAEPAVGRFLAPDEVGPEAGVPVVVIGFDLWQEHFDGAESIVGEEITVNGVPTSVVGVAPEGFRGNVGPLRMQAWVPFGMQASGLLPGRDMENRRASMLQVVGRLRESATLDRAADDLAGAMAGLVESWPEAMEGRGVAVSQLSGLPAPIRPMLGAFMGVLMVLVGLVLIVACVNVAGMLLARGASRSREIAVRLSIGASRGRLVRQLLVETLVLFTLGGLAGVLLATWCTAFLSRLQPPTPPPYDVSFALSLDARVLLFTLAAVLLSALIFGLGPAYRATSPSLVPALKDQQAGGSPRRSRGRALLLGGQVALTVLLLVTSALFLRALAYAGNVRLGFDPEGVYTMGLNLELAGHDASSGLSLWRELRDSLEPLPGVESFAAVRVVPLGLPQRMGFGGVTVDGVEAPPGGFDADVNVVSSGYFATLGMRLLAGSDLARSGEPAGEVGGAVINESMARGLWPDQTAVGRPFTLGNTDLTVVGVVADAKYSTLSEETPWFVYLPLDGWYQGDLTLLLRADAGALSEVGSVLRRVEPRLPAPSVAPLADAVAVATLPQRLAALVSGAMGVVGLVLAGIGIYGVTAYATAQRTREVGVRMALGARRREVETLVLRQGMVAPTVGALSGLLLAIPVAGLIRSYLLGVPAFDPISFAGATLTLLAAATLACWLPARRAAGVDPVSALRSE